MTCIDAILDGIRRELLKRPPALEGGMSALLLTCYFEGDTWTPRRVVVRPRVQHAASAAGTYEPQGFPDRD